MDSISLQQEVERLRQEIEYHNLAEEMAEAEG